MRAWVLFVAALSFASPAAAQVINGESTYEDNYAHTPPSEPDAAKPVDRESGKAPTRDAPDEVQHDRRARDRD